MGTSMMLPLSSHIADTTATRKVLNIGIQCKFDISRDDECHEITTGGSRFIWEKRSSGENSPLCVALSTSCSSCCVSSPVIQTDDPISVSRGHAGKLFCDRANNNEWLGKTSGEGNKLWTKDRNIFNLDEKGLSGTTYIACRIISEWLQIIGYKMWPHSIRYLLFQCLVRSSSSPVKMALAFSFDLVKHNGRRHSTCTTKTPAGCSHGSDTTNGTTSPCSINAKSTRESTMEKDVPDSFVSSCVSCGYCCGGWLSDRGPNEVVADRSPHGAHCCSVDQHHYVLLFLTNNLRFANISLALIIWWN